MDRSIDRLIDWLIDIVICMILVDLGPGWCKGRRYSYLIVPGCEESMLRVFGGESVYISWNLSQQGKWVILIAASAVQGETRPILWTLGQRYWLPYRFFTRHVGSARACVRYRQGVKNIKPHYIISYTFWISIGYQTSLFDWTGSKLNIFSKVFLFEALSLPPVWRQKLKYIVDHK